MNDLTDHPEPQVRPQPATVRGVLRAEGAFSIIEAIIAMLILTVVVGGAAYAITSSMSLSSKHSIRADQAAVARKVMERVEGDLAMRERCISTIWRGSPPWQPCTQAQADGGRISVQDDRGRTWNATVSVLPIDDGGDGSGSGAGGGATAAASPGGDADQRVHDRYEAIVSVTLDEGDASATSVGRTPHVLKSFLGWEASLDPSLRMDVCQHYRRDRTIDASSCSAGGLRPLAGVVVRLSPVEEPGNAANGKPEIRGTSGTDGIVRFPTRVPIGSWNILVADQRSATFYRSTPSVVTLGSGEQQHASVIMVAQPGNARVCARISNADNYGFGYRVTSTHALLNEQYSPVYTGTPVSLDPTWDCSTSLVDPLGYNAQQLFGAAYGLELEEIPSELDVKQVTMNCTAGSPSNLPVTPPEPAARLDASWKGVFEQVPAATTTVCVEAWSNPVIAVDCSSGEPGCIFIGMECRAYCPAGETRCVANCDAPADPDAAPTGGGGTVTPIGTRTGSSYGGPNDSDSGGKCMMDAGGSGWFPGTGGYTNVPTSSWAGRQWTGGTSASAGRFADGGIYMCKEVTFATKDDIPRGTCLEVSYGGRKVRGRARDRIGASGRIDLTIGASMGLLGQDNYNAFQWGIRPVQVARVDGDSTCQSGASSGPVSEFFPPEIVEIWKKPDPECPIGCKDPAATTETRGNAGGGRNTT